MSKKTPRTVEVFYKHNIGQWLAKDQKLLGGGVIFALTVKDQNKIDEAIAEASEYCGFPAKKIKVITGE